MSDILSRLTAELQQRQQADPTASYVAGLYHKGLDAILKKVGEEAAETLIAAKNPSRDALVHEIADLWFHTLVLLVHQGATATDVLVELERRFGVSGHAEKVARTQD